MHSLFSPALLLLISALLPISYASAQDFDYSGMDYNELIDTYNLGLDNAFGDTPDPLNFSDGIIPGTGNADFEVAQEIANRALIADPNYDYVILQGFNGDLYQYSPDTGPIFLGEGAAAIANLPDGDNYTVIIFTNYPGLYSFYNNLPDAFIDSDLSFNLIFLREPQSSQSSMDAALSSFNESTLASDPFIKLGLQYVEDIVLIKSDSDDTEFTNSPSQYNSLENVIYINSSDLILYGEVVIFHELLQAGVLNALTNGYISNDDFELLNSFNSKYFSHLGLSYINVDDDHAFEELAVLTAMKAFAIGYTYKVFNNYEPTESSAMPSSVLFNSSAFFSAIYNGLFNTYSVSSANVHKSRFMSDVESNKHVLDIKTEWGGTLAMHLIGQPQDTNQADINDFIDMFTDNSSAANEDIQSVIDKINTHQGTLDFIKLLPILAR